LPDWFIFTPWGFVGFVLFMIAANAEANRSPFDLPEGESEIIAGYFIEYSGFKFALFFLAEYLSLFAICGLGYHAVPRRLECAVRRAGIHSVVGVVLPQAAFADVPVHLDAGHAAPHAPGSTHELRVEIHDPDGAHQSRRRRALAFHQRRARSLAGSGALLVGAYLLLGRGLNAEKSPNAPIALRIEQMFKTLKRLSYRNS
jgi:hypothetical protein